MDEIVEFIGGRPVTIDPAGGRGPSRENRQRLEFAV